MARYLWQATFSRVEFSEICREEDNMRVDTPAQATAAYRSHCMASKTTESRGGNWVESDSDCALCGKHLHSPAYVLAIAISLLLENLRDKFYAVDIAKLRVVAKQKFVPLVQHYLLVIICLKFTVEIFIWLGETTVWFAHDPSLYINWCVILAVRFFLLTPYLQRFFSSVISRPNQFLCGLPFRRQ